MIPSHIEQDMHYASEDSRAQTESPGKETGTFKSEEHNEISELNTNVDQYNPTHLFNGMFLNPLEQGIHGIASEMDEGEAADLFDAPQITQDAIDPSIEENDLPDGDMHGMSHDRRELNDSPAISAYPELEDLKNTGKINKENNSCSSPEHCPPVWHDETLRGKDRAAASTWARHKAEVKQNNSCIGHGYAEFLDEGDMPGDAHKDKTDLPVDGPEIIDLGGAV